MEAEKGEEPVKWQQAEKQAASASCMRVRQRRGKTSNAALALSAFHQPPVTAPPSLLSSCPQSSPRSAMHSHCSRLAQVPRLAAGQHSRAKGQACDARGAGADHEVEADSGQKSPSAAGSGADQHRTRRQTNDSESLSKDSQFRCSHYCPHEPERHRPTDRLRHPVRRIPGTLSVHG